MNDNDLKKLFGDLPQPDARKKSEAIAAALAAFDENLANQKNDQASQGSVEVVRLTPEQQKRSEPMNTVLPSKFHSTRFLAGFATAAVICLAVFISLKLPEQTESIPLTEVDSDVQPATPAEKTITEEAVVATPAVAALQSDQPPLMLRKEISQRQSQRANLSGLPAASPEADMSPARHKLEAVAGFSGQSLVDIDHLPPVPRLEEGRERFESVDSNPVKSVRAEPVSTFSVDTDTSAYSFIRSQLNSGRLPQKAAVRLEEMINYFPYAYPLPENRQAPFSTLVTVIDSPWKAGNKLVHIGIQGYEIVGEQPRSNLVFLLDVSGSMNQPNKLPLVKQAMGLLLTRLKPDDLISVVVYAGAAGTVLDATPVREKQKILDALGNLTAGGSTAGAAAIRTAYQLAKAHFIKDGVNRIILATDGDFNVGITNRDELKGFVERQRESGIFLSVLGFGQGNYHDYLMQTLAQNGNGTAAYIDSLGEAQKVLVDEATSALFPIAKDVKIQVEFNPATVSEYRLLGYETRLLNQEDFKNDAVDAGEIGAGHNVTAIYEITPVGSGEQLLPISRYQEEKTAAQGKPDEYGFVKLRYKLPDQNQSQLISTVIAVDASPSQTALHEARFATAVAGFGQLLQGGKYTGQWNYQNALDLAQANKGDDPYGYRAEFVQLIRKAQLAEKM